MMCDNRAWILNFDAEDASDYSGTYVENVLCSHSLAVCMMRRKNLPAFWQAGVGRVLDLIQVIFLFSYVNKSFKIL